MSWHSRGIAGELCVEHCIACFTLHGIRMKKERECDNYFAFFLISFTTITLCTLIAFEVSKSFDVKYTFFSNKTGLLRGFKLFLLNKIFS